MAMANGDGGHKKMRDEDGNGMREKPTRASALNSLDSSSTISPLSPFIFVFVFVLSRLY